MRPILIVYGTTDGHTRSIAQFLCATLRVEGFGVDVIEAGTLAPHPEYYSGVIVAASVRGGRYQRPVTAWVRRHAEALAKVPSAFVSVSLGVVQKDPKVQQEVAAIAERWLASAGWVPTFTKPIAGALLYTKHNWLIRSIMAGLSRKAGGSTDTSRDHIYTDWHDLRRLAEQFGRTVHRNTAPHVLRAA